MKKVRIFSVLRFLGRCVNGLLVAGCLVAIVGALIWQNVEFKLEILITIGVIIGIQVLLEVLHFSGIYICKRTIIFEFGKVHFINNVYTKEKGDRLLYTKITFKSFISLNPGELIVVSNGKRILLGFYTYREVKKMQKFIDILIDRETIVEP